MIQQASWRAAALMTIVGVAGAACKSPAPPSGLVPTAGVAPVAVAGGSAVVAAGVAAGAGAAGVAAAVAGMVAVQPVAGTAPAAGSGRPAAKGDIPCEAADVIKRHCVRCHGRTLHEGAPWVLVEAADFQRLQGGQTLGAAALKRVQDDMRPMPPPPAARVSGQDLTALANWINAGAQVASPGCVVDDSAPETGGAAGAGVVVTMGAAGSGGTRPPDPTANDHAGDWSMFGVDLANSRNNVAEKTIGVDSVSKLHEVWRFKGPGTTSAPAVVDGVVYLPGWDGKVYAMHLEDGSAVWTTTLPDLIDSSPTVTATQVYVSDDNGSVHALDRKTGTKQWSHSVDSHPEAHLWSSPIYIPSASLIVVGVASGEEAVLETTYTFRGSVVGLDAATGNEKWRFETASMQSGSGPGVAVWSTAVVDEMRKLVFIGTGNNYQAPNSEYCDSLLAINYETGKLAWSKQFTTSDVYTVFGMQGSDFDIGGTANLFTVDGHDYVGIGVKSGIYYALDRETGTIKWMTMITPGAVLGGVISASAYANGFIFVASNEYSASKTLLVGIDARNGQIMWRFETPQITYGGVSHANGVVFLGTTAGSIFGVDGATGKMLWADMTPNKQPIAGSPTVAHGRLLVPWGYMWTLREGTAGQGGLTVYAP